MSFKKYNSPRLSIPIVTQRQIKVEARHQCAICQEKISLTIHHIDYNRDNNKPENLLCVCRNCHGRLDRKEITMQEAIIYKNKLLEKDEQILRLRKEVSELEGGSKKIASKAYQSLKSQYQEKIGDLTDKFILFQGFIYISPIYYIDERGDNVRQKIRVILQINETDEKYFLTKLKEMELIEQAGGIIALRNTSTAKICLKELIENRGIDIEKVISIFD